MTTITRRFAIEADPDVAWRALADIGAPNRLIDFLGDVHLDGAYRICSLGDQGDLRELIVSVDSAERRVAYSIQSSPFDFVHHHAAMQIISDDHGTQCSWITDFAPDDLAEVLGPVIDAGVASITRALSQGAE